MTLLTRIFRKNPPRAILERAEALLDAPLGLFVLDFEDNILYPRGASPPRPESLAVAPVLLDDMELGRVLVASRNGHAPDGPTSKLAAKVAGLTAAALAEILRGEVVRRGLAGETLQKYRELALLHRATVSLNDSLRTRDVAQALLKECQSGDVPAEAGMIYLKTEGHDFPSPYLSFGPSGPCGLAKVVDSTLFLDILRSQKAEIINDLSSDRRWRGEARELRAMLIAPLVSSCRCVGALVLGTCGAPRFEANHLQYVSTLASVAGISMGNALNFESIQALIKSLMQALATAIDARDPFTAGHSQRVARLGVALSKIVHQDARYFPEVAFSESDLHEILYAGLLHDVGKIGIREEVLTKATKLSEPLMEVIGLRLALWGQVTSQAWSDDFQRLRRINRADGISREDAALIASLGAKELTVGDSRLPILSDEEIQTLLIPRGNLTPEERREIERHPSESYRILQHIPFPENMRRLLTIISQHHERLDGSGYPAGLKGEEILLQSRIIAIVDIYDAITMARHYKPALSREEGLAVLTREAEAGRIDHDLVRLLARHVEDIETDAMDLAMRQDFGDYLQTRPIPAH